MDNLHGNDSGVGANGTASCPQCGYALVSGARFCGHCGSRARNVEPPPRVSRLIVHALTGAWLVISLLILSEPSPGILLWVAEFYMILGIGLSWIVLLAPAAYRTLKALGRAGIPSVSGCLAALPLATLILILALAYQVPLKARLELGEGALLDYAERVEAGEPDSDSYHIWRLIGVFQVHQAYKRDGCVIFVTDQFGVEDEEGLAYCTGRLPCGPTVEMDRVKGNWWTWNYWSTNESC